MVAVSAVEEDSVEAEAEALEVAVEDSLVASGEHPWETTEATGGGGKCQAVMEEETDIDGGTE